MTKFCILSKGRNSYSANRLKEELKKYSFEVFHWNICDLMMTNKGLFWKDSLVNLEDGDVLWSVDNSTMTHLALSSIEKNKKSFLWPDSSVFELANKFKANCFFSRIGAQTPATVLVSNFDYENIIKKMELKFPLVLKKNHGSKGENVFLTKNINEIDIAIKEMLQEQSISFPMKNTTFILQEFIAESKGSDYRVLCIKDKIIGGIKRTSQKDFRANIALGGKAENFEVKEELAEICRHIMRKSGIFYAGIDFIKSDRGWLAIEINTCAQFKGFENGTGINVAEKIINAIIKQ